MMEERNFRSHYYDKVGFRVVEEKKSLEILLKEKPIDRIKLKQFALRFPVPAIHRQFLWELILDILPIYIDQHSFVRGHREEQYNDLSQIIRVLQLQLSSSPNSQISLSKSNTFILMKFMEIGTLKINFLSQIESREGKSYCKIFEALGDSFNCDADVFWISKGMCELSKLFRPFLPALEGYAHKLLNKKDPELHGYLISQNMLDFLPFQEWFEIFFSGIIPFHFLQKIWDKILGGSSIILVYVAISLIMRNKYMFFKEKNIKTILEKLNKIEDSLAEAIVTESIEMWQQNGSPLFPGSNTDCFKGYNSQYRTKIK